MKQITLLILVPLIFLQSFNKVLLFVSFKINQNEIAKTLCVKKNIKFNTCQGKCHLKKELKKDDEKEATSNQKLKEILWYCLTKKAFDFSNIKGNTLCKLLVNYQSGVYINIYLSKIFRPPKFISYYII